MITNDRCRQGCTRGEMEDRIADLERALYAALNGVEVVIDTDGLSALEWTTLDDGRRMVRRARQ